MGIKKINNIFSDEEISYFNKTFNDVINGNTEKSFDFSISEELGRVEVTVHNIQGDILKKPIKIAQSSLDFDCEITSVTFVEYSSKYGKPDLPPHFDGDNNDLIVNYQLASNTSWHIGVDLEIYNVEDNSALVFNPNKNAHWRTIKLFDDKEFIRMIFFRFANSNRLTDYSYLRQYSPTDDIFIDLCNLRNSFTQ